MIDIFLLENNLIKFNRKKSIQQQKTYQKISYYLNRIMSKEKFAVFLDEISFPGQTVDFRPQHVIEIWKVIWAIKKALQCILQGVRLLLAKQTRLSGTSDNESYMHWQKHQHRNKHIYQHKQQKHYFQRHKQALLPIATCHVCSGVILREKS